MSGEQKTGESPRAPPFSSSGSGESHESSTASAAAVVLFKEEDFIVPASDNPDDDFILDPFQIDREIDASYKKKLDVVGERLSGIFSRAKKEYEEVKVALEAGEDENISKALPSDALKGEAVIPMLKNKVRKMKNELDIAELKYKASEVQLRADKAKFTDVLNYSKRENENIRIRLQNLEAKQRYQEQMNRDPNFVGGGVVSKKELDEVLLECDSLKAMIVSISSERLQIERALKEAEDDLAAALDKTDTMERLKDNFEREAIEARERSASLEAALAAANALVQQRNDEIVLLQADCNKKLAVYFDNLDELARRNEAMEQLEEQLLSRDDAIAALHAQGDAMASKLHRALGAARGASACMEESHAAAMRRLREQAHRVLEAEKALVRLGKSGAAIVGSPICRGSTFKPDSTDACVNTDIKRFVDHQAQVQAQTLTSGTDPVFQNWQSASTNTDSVTTSEQGSEIDDELRHYQEQYDRLLEEQGDGGAVAARLGGGEGRSAELDAEIEELRVKLKDKSNLLHLGEVRIENFDRMKDRGFGPDSLVRLSYVEYCLNYDRHEDDDGEEDEEERAVRLAQRKKLRVQLQSLRVEKELILDSLVQQCSLHELAQFKTATERAILQISSFNVLTSLEHFKSGGVYLDILRVHRVVLDKVINKAGGWQHAMSLVRREAATADFRAAVGLNMRGTDHWPDFFRIKVLELYRQNLAASIDDMAEHISRAAAERQAVSTAHAEERALLQQELSSLAADVAALKEKKRGGGRYARAGVTKESSTGPFPATPASTATPATPAIAAAAAPATPAATAAVVEAPPNKPNLSSILSSAMSKKTAEGDAAAAKALAAREAELREAIARTHELELQLSAAKDAADASSIFRRLHASADELLFRALYHLDGDSAESDTITCYIEGLLEALESWREGYYADTENALNMCAEVIGEHNDTVRDSDDELVALLREDKQISLGIVEDLRLLLEGLHLDFAGEVSEVHSKLSSFIGFRERLRGSLQAPDETGASASVSACEDAATATANVVSEDAATDTADMETLDADPASHPVTAAEGPPRSSCAETQTTARGDVSCEEEIVPQLPPSSLRLQLPAPKFISLDAGLSSMELTDRDSPTPPLFEEAVAPIREDAASAAVTAEDIDESRQAPAPALPPLTPDLDPATASGTASAPPTPALAAVAPPPPQRRLTLLTTTRVASVAVAPSPSRPSPELQELARQTEAAAVASEKRLNLNSKKVLKGAAKGVAAELALMRVSRKKQVDESEKRLRDAEEKFQRDVNDAVQKELRKVEREVSDAHVQTDPEGEVELVRQAQAQELLLRQNAAGAELAASDPHYNPNALPPGFLLVHVANRQLEMCPGVFMVTYQEHHIRPCKLPKNVVYCHREENAAYSRALRRLPRYVPVPTVHRCEAVVVPTVLDLPYHCGVQLVFGASLGSPSCVELPCDVFVVRMAGRGSILPPGLTVVSLSAIVKIPDSVIIPVHLDAVQIGSQVVLPAGVEVSEGCTIAPVPEGMTLPSNVVLIERRQGTRIPPFMTPLVATSDVDVEVKVIEIARESVTIVKRPADIAFNVGVEVICRPPGHAIPAGMAPLPAALHPPQLHLRGDLELVQLAPRFDFPGGCSPSPGWSFYPRPAGQRLPIGTYLLRRDEERGIGGALPPFLRAVPIPSHSYDVKLPPSVIAVEFLGGVAQPLPEGAVIAPGIRVLPFSSIFPGGVLDPSALAKMPCNAIIAERLPDSPLPQGVERGTRTDLPVGTLLPANVEVLLLSVRFEVPHGVRVDPNVVLGYGVQLPPGTRLHPHVEVMEWPAFTFLQPGTELVRVDAGRSLPEELSEVLVPRHEVQQYGLDRLAGGDCKIVRLPHHLSMLQSSVEMSEGVHTVSRAQLSAYCNEAAARAGERVDAASVALPAGVALVRREALSCRLPAGMVAVGRADLPHDLAALLSRKVIEVSGSATPTMPIEAVRLYPTYRYAPGTEIFPGVYVLPRPHWLHAHAGPLWLELVTVTAVTPAVARELDALILRLRPDVVAVSATETAQASLPDGCVVVSLPEGGLANVHRWGSGAPGVESVLLPRGLHLPPAHYVVRRMIKHHLPACYRMGFSREYERMAVKLTLPPSLEVMHVVPSYHFPAGVTVLDTAVLRANYTEPSERRMLAGSCLQLAYGELLGECVCYVPFPPDWDLLSNSFTTDDDNDEGNGAERWIFVAVASGCALPRGFAVHDRSTEAVRALFASHFKHDLAPGGGISCSLDQSLYANNFCGALVAGEGAADVGGACDGLCVTDLVKLVSLPAELPHYRVRAMHKEDLLIRELRADTAADTVAVATARSYMHTYSAAEYDYLVRSAGDESGSNLTHLTADVLDNIVVIHPRMISGLNEGDIDLDEMTKSERQDLQASEALIALSAEHDRRRAAGEADPVATDVTDVSTAVTSDLITAAATKATTAAAGDTVEAVAAAGTSPSEAPPVSTKVLFHALERAQDEIDALGKENDQYRLAMTAAMREREQLNIVIARHEETIASEREEYRLCRELVARVRKELTKAETLVKLKHNDWTNLRSSAESTRSRMQGQINSLNDQVALWQDASSDATAIRQLMDDSLAAREVQAEERLCRREAAVRSRGAELLRAMLRQLALLAEQVVSTAHARALESLRNVTAFKGRTGNHLAPLQATIYTTVGGDAHAGNSISNNNNNVDIDNASIGDLSADSGPGDHLSFGDSLPDGAAAANSSAEEDSDHRGGLDDDVSILSDDGTVNTIRSVEGPAAEHTVALSSGSRPAASSRPNTKGSSSSAAAADFGFLSLASSIRIVAKPPLGVRRVRTTTLPLPESVASDRVRHAKGRQDGIIGELTRSNVHLADGINASANGIDGEGNAVGRVLDFAVLSQEVAIQRIMETCIDVLSSSGGDGDDDNSDLAERTEALSAQLTAWVSGVVGTTRDLFDIESTNYQRALHLTETELESLVQASWVQQRKIKMLRERVVSLTPIESARTAAAAPSMRTNPLEEVARIEQIADLERELRQARSLALGSVRSNLVAFASKVRSLQHLERQLRYFYFIHKRLSLEEEKKGRRLQLKPDSEKKQRAVAFYADRLRRKADSYGARADAARQEAEALTDSIREWMGDYEQAVSSLLPKKLINNILRRAGSEAAATDITSDNISIARVPGGLGAPLLLSPIRQRVAGSLHEASHHSRRPSLSSMGSESNGSIATQSSLLSASSLRSFASTVRSDQRSVASTAQSLPGNFFSAKLTPHFGAPGTMPVAQNLLSLTQFSGARVPADRKVKSRDRRGEL